MTARSVSQDDVVLHVKAHLTPEFDHLSGADVATLVALTAHTLKAFGVIATPAALEALVAERVIEVLDLVTRRTARIEPTVLVALELVGWACWRSLMRRLGDACDWLDARLES